MERAVTVGAALSRSGRFAAQGEQARRGLLLWAEHVNAAGGLRVGTTSPPRPVKLQVCDDASTRAGAAAATERLIVHDRVTLLFGPYGSVLTLAAADVAARHGRVLWNHGGSSDAIDQRGWRHVVSVLSPASRYVAPLLDLATHATGPTGRPLQTVALVAGPTGTFPEAVMAGARAHAARLGLMVVLDTTYPPGYSSLYADPDRAPPAASTLLAELAALQPELILGAGTTEADLAFARELRRQRLQPALVGLVAAPIERFRDALGPDADGFCGPSQWEPTLRDQPDLGPTSARLHADFRARFGLEPDYTAAQAYAAGLIAARCAELAGSLDDAALLAAAATLDLTTCYGRFRLDPATGRQVGHELVVAQWQAGQKQVVWPPARATAPPQLPLPAAAPTSRPLDRTASS